MQFAGLSKDTAPRLLSDNGKCYLSTELKRFLADRGIRPVNGKPCHPQTQGKIERYHRTMKNVIKLDNYYSPQDLILAISEFVDHYNNHRYHESLNNLTPADVYCGRDREILLKRQKIKAFTLRTRRRNYAVEKLKFIYAQL